MPKPNGGLQLCIDDWGFNKLIIKNWYPLLLVSNSPDRLGRAKQYIKLDLTDAYYQICIKKGDK